MLNSKFNSLRLFNCKFNFLYWINCSNGYSVVENVAIFIDLILNNTNFNKTLHIIENKEQTITKINLESCKFQEEFILDGNSKDINSIFITCSKQLEGSIYIKNFNISLLYLKGDNYNSKIDISSCKISTISLSGFYNYNKVSFSYIRALNANSLLKITDSILGLSQFHNCDLNSFNSVWIYNSSIIECIFVNIKWFDEAKLNLNKIADNDLHMTKDEENSYLIDKKEIFRQIKFSLEKQGNRTDSMRFNALELKAFKAEKFNTTQWYNKIFEKDRFVLWLSQSNDFGLNWVKPVRIALYASIFFYIVLVISMSNKLSFFCLNLSKESINITFKELLSNSYALPQIANPVHNLNNAFNTKEHLSFLTNFIDFFYRIVMTYLIFQIVSAFRKYIKS